MKTKHCFILIFYVFACIHIFAQKSKPLSVLSKEACNLSALVSVLNIEISNVCINEKLLNQCLATLQYNTVYRKLNNKYTITKCITKNNHNEKQIDTIIKISSSDYKTQFIYYKIKGKNLPTLIEASISCSDFVTGKIKVGMAQLLVDRVHLGDVDARIDDVTNNAMYYITDAAHNSSFSFEIKNGILEKIVYNSYWD